jgi:hypothetical protein
MDGVQVSAAGWFDLLRHRIINWTQDYVSWDQVDLAWDLISQTQAQQYGGIGIARGTAPTSHVLRTIHYGAEECKVLGDAIDELATMSNGFDYEIQPDLTWMTYYPSKGLDKGITFEFGKNISGIAWTLDASAMVNQLTGIGSGSGPNTLKSVASDAVLENAYGLLQGSMTFSDITQQGILDTRTFEALRLVKVVRSQPQLQVYTNDPPFGSYGIGDIVQINAQDGFFNLAEKKRIISIVVAVSNEGVDNVGLEFAEPLP